MRPVNLCSFGLFFLTLSTFFFSCSETPYTGGACSEPSDCGSDFQFVPGTTCRGQLCECIDPTLHICCKAGDDGPNCKLQCLPCDECAETTPGKCPPACTKDEDCPGPPDPRCGTGRCFENKCTIDRRNGPIASQLRGDCKILECNYEGEVVEVEHLNDRYDDGNECTYDFCEHDLGPVNEPFPVVTCPTTKVGICWDGACVECVPNDPNLRCGGGLVCDGHKCVPAHCDNNVVDTDLGETDFNCGGACRPCATGSRCKQGTDCIDGVCEGGLCEPPTCTDGVKNGSETDVDCGTSSCPRCSAGQGCKLGADCTSGVCWKAVCQAPTCTDGMKNGDELGVDCGGTCPMACQF